MESLRQIRERNLIELTKVITVEDALMLQRISHRLHQLDENACNWGLTERQEKRVDRLEAQAEEIAQRYNLRAYHQTDPRGWSLYLIRAGENAEIDYSTEPAVCPH